MGIDFRRPRHIRGFRLGEVLVFDPGKTLVEKTVSGSVIHIEDGADNVPISNFVCTINPLIDGTSSITIYNQSKNLIRLYTRSSNAGVNYSINADGSLHREGLATSNSYNNGNMTTYASCPYKFKAGTYTISISGSTTPNDYVSFGMISASGSSLTAQNIYGNNTKTFTVEEDFGAWYWCKVNSGTNVNDNMYISFVEGDQAGETVPPSTNAPLGRTIYGGTADVLTGEGTDAYAKDSMSSTYLSGLSSDYIGYESSTAYFGGHPSIWVRNWNYQRAKARQSGGIGCVCNYFPVSMHNTTIFSSQYRIYFDVNGKNISSVQDFIDFVTALEQNNESLDIVFELATSTDFTFTPVSSTPKTALGVNNFWNDKGESSVTYYAYAD